MKKFKKKLCVLMSLMLMLTGICFSSYTVSAYDLTFTVESWDHLDALIYSLHESGYSDLSATFIITDNIREGGDFYGIHIPTELNITIKSEDGHTYRIDNTFTGPHFYLEDKSTLTLENVILDGNYGGGVQVNSANATLVMKNGSVINATDNLTGNAITLNAGRLIMNSGTVDANRGIYVSRSATAIIGQEGSTDYVYIKNCKYGGIYTEDTTYSNITTYSNVWFENNSAVTVYEPPENALQQYPNIQFAHASYYGHPLNNADINYVHR